MCRDESIIHILWTGGWDSTFRVLSLLREGRLVKPHYLIDRARRSTEHELQAMEAIRSAILHAPELTGTLLPMEVHSKGDSLRHPEIRRAYLAIIREVYIGEQYMWLADYCAEKGITDMEIGVENNPIIKQAIGSSDYPYSEIFGRFSFPIISIDKLDMKRWAKDAGVLEILEKSWFCHNPTTSMAPCGTCHPCEVTIKAGMQYRLPLTSRIRYHMRVVPRLRAFLKRFPAFYSLLYKTKHGS